MKIVIIRKGSIRKVDSICPYVVDVPPESKS